jgi:hypothetical protein
MKHPGHMYGGFVPTISKWGMTQFTLSVWETDLEQREEKLAEEQAQGLYSFDGRDLSV